MKLACLIILLAILTPTLTHRLQRLQHSWWCSKDQDSAPFQLISENGNIFSAGKPAIASYQWLKTGTNPSSWFISTWVNGKKQIKYNVEGAEYVAYLRPQNKVTTWKWGAVCGQNYLPNYKVSVYLIDCASDAKKVEVVAKDEETGILSYMSSSKPWTIFGTQDYYTKTNGKNRECFSVKN